MKRFMFFVFVVAIAAIPATIFAWLKYYDGKGRDVGKCVQPTSDGGYVIVGDSEPYEGGEGEQDIWLIKTDDNGDTLWTRFYGNQWHDYGESVHQTTDGGYFITGNTTIEEPSYELFLWLLRTNPSGDTLSTRLYEDRWAGWGEPTSDGGFIIAGGVIDDFDRTPLLFKVNEYGDSVWARRYDEYEGRVLSFVQQTSDGGFIGSGLIDITYIWVLKTNSAGDVEWSKILHEGLYLYHGCVRETSDSGFVVVGGEWDPAGAKGMCLYRLDQSGETLWSKWYYLIYAFRLLEISDGGFVITKYAGLLRTDDAGDTLWSRDYNAGNINDIRLTDDGGFVMTGTGVGTGGYEDLWIIKTDEEGHAYDRGVSPVEIVSPEPSDEDFYWCIPSAYFRNLGIEDVSDFYCHCEIIGELFSEITPDYHDSVWIEETLEKDEEIGVTFREWMSQDTVGAWFYAVFYTTKEDDIDWGCVPKVISFKAAANPGIEEDFTSSQTWTLTSSCGSFIALHYSGYPQGFSARVFDASGRKVDEIKSSSCSGMVTWGECYGPGVYFIVPRIGVKSPRKVVLIR